MNKRNELLAAVKVRALRPQEDIKGALGYHRERKWRPQLLSFRTEDVERLEKIRTKVLRGGLTVSKSEIVRAALLALQECSNAAGLVGRLDR
ncbi:MAG: hypothetical protein Q7J73_10770 [Dehalococcoidales bacterium]|jgi:hypothetical protein|nr:hypothetical protein [Dehalococcoidales bacterium]